MSTAGAAHAGAGPGDHLVQFYDGRRDTDLAGPAAAFLRPAIMDGGTAIVVATPRHRAAFEHALAADGIDVPAARAANAYRDMDAASLLAHLTSDDGRLDQVSFEQNVGKPIAAAVAGGGPVRVYGEMVVLLWEAGHGVAALELERRWEDLGRSCEFALYCGYPVGSVTGDGITQVCLCHDGTAGRVTGTEIRVFPFSPEAPGNARRFAVVAASRLGVAHLADDVALVVAELAANAMLHARSALTLTLQLSPGTLRIAVRDNTPLPRAGLAVDPLHGLGLVAALAKRWGVLPIGTGAKAVWAELAVTQTPLSR